MIAEPINRVVDVGVIDSIVLCQNRTQYFDCAIVHIPDCFTVFLAYNNREVEGLARRVNICGTENYGVCVILENQKLRVFIQLTFHQVHINNRWRFRSRLRIVYRRHCVTVNISNSHSELGLDWGYKVWMGVFQDLNVQVQFK
jgi:hypothetical protein